MMRVRMGWLFLELMAQTMRRKESKKRLLKNVLSVKGRLNLTSKGRPSSSLITYPRRRARSRR